MSHACSEKFLVTRTSVLCDVVDDDDDDESLDSCFSDWGVSCLRVWW